MFSLFKKKEPTVQEQLGSVPWLRIAVPVLGVIGLYVFSQVIMAAATAAVGLALIAGLGIVAIAVFQALPMLAQKWENRLLAMRKNEARKNPIEQAQNDYLRKCEQYEAFKTALEKIGGMVANYGSRLEKKRREKPNYDLRTELDALEKMKAFYQNRKERLVRAQQVLVVKKEKIEEATFKWEAQLEANAAIRAMNATDKEAKINEILTEIAFKSVDQEYNAVFAKLDIDAAEISGQQQLEFAPGVALDISAVNVSQPQLVESRR
jgi:hypothetical protein